MAFLIKEHVAPCQHIREYLRATALVQEAVLQLAIKQYTPIDNPSPQPGDVTIIGAQANGFPKEIYEPLWEEIHARSAANGFRIRSIWIADMAHQGASGVLNEDLIGDDPSWMDHSRDLLHMINHFRAEMPLPIVGIGHSIGTVNLINLSLMHPRLLATVVLLDTVVEAPRHSSSTSSATARQPVQGANPAQASTFRRDLWPSRAAAAESFTRAEFYQSWDPRVLERWLVHGLRETPTAVYPVAPVGSVTLTTTKHQEVLTYLRPRLSFRGTYDAAARAAYPDMDQRLDPAPRFYRPEQSSFERLPFLRPSALYIFGSASPQNPPEARRDKVNNTGIATGGSGGAREGRVRGEVLESLGHLVAMEAPGRCAELAAPWIAAELSRWRREHEAWRAWTKKPYIEKITVSAQWRELLAGPRPEPLKGKI